MILKSKILMATTVFVLMAGISGVHAEEMMKMDHSQMTPSDMKTGLPKLPDPVIDPYAEAMDRMHKDMMAVKPTGEVDVDFVREMIPHHQGALDMAEVVLKKGKDPVIRKLAEQIATAQKSEIRFMKDWLADHESPAKAAAAPKPAPKVAPKEPLKK